MIITYGDALLNVLGTILLFTIIGYRNLIGNIPEELFQSSMYFLLNLPHPSSTPDKSTLVLKLSLNQHSFELTNIK